ncbi:MAG: hypothetical protein GAK45_01623 [Pseudomonas citronellolis]|nr:MAG: hypothetical protein GAK45_01623 [Pseudomonas citronellolis]
MPRYALRLPVLLLCIVLLCLTHRALARDLQASLNYVSDLHPLFIPQAGHLTHTLQRILDLLYLAPPLALLAYVLSYELHCLLVRNAPDGPLLGLMMFGVYGLVLLAVLSAHLIALDFSGGVLPAASSYRPCAKMHTLIHVMSTQALVFITLFLLLDRATRRYLHAQA